MLRVGLECHACHELVRDLRGEAVITYLGVEVVLNTCFEEDGPGALSSLAGAATTFSFTGLVSKAGGVPASLWGGAAGGTFNPLPFFLLEAKGSSLGFF